MSFKPKANKKYFINPKGFKVYKNGSINYGGLKIYVLSGMFVLTAGYVNEIYRSSHVPWSIDDTVFGANICKILIEKNIVSETPYEGIQISIDSNSSQKLNIGDYCIKIDYASNYSNPKHELWLGKTKLEESDSLYDLYEKVLLKCGVNA